MARTRPFSIYLLKKNFNAKNALNEDHSLEILADAKELPPKSTLYILDSERRRPWWRAYFGIKKELWQSSKGALLFLPVGNECFVLSFGHVSHHLKEEAYEYDFGLLVTLNSLDPNKLKSADMLDPGEARRKRTQVPVSTELTYLDFDGNSEVIKSLTGKVKPQYVQLFRDATGAASFRVNLKLSPAQLAGLCKTLHELYQRDDYKTAFPNIRNIAPIKDPIIVSKLDQALVDALRVKADEVTLTIPDIVDYRGDTCCTFQGSEGQSEVYPDITIEMFFDYLGDGFDFEKLDITDLKNFRMTLTDADGNASSSYSIYRSLLYETKLAGDNASYHLCEGNWYKVDSDYAARLKAYLDSKCEDTDLCPYDHDEVKNGNAIYSEGKYNSAVPVWKTNFICLDKMNIAPPNNTAIEPCDLYTVAQDPTVPGGFRSLFYHVKISTRSAQLSHLFNQGMNAVELVKLEPQCRNKLKELISENIGVNDEQRYLAPIDSSHFKVVFSIITHKNKDAHSDNLPLFSKISLRRNMQRLDLMQVPCALTFVRDQSPHKEGFNKNKRITVQVYENVQGKSVIRPIVGQGVDVDEEVARCPKAIKESAIGSRFRIFVKIGDDGSLSSFHDWPYDQV